LVHVFAVTNAGYLYKQIPVVNCVHHAIVACAEAVLAVTTLHFLATRRAGIEGKAFNARENALYGLVR
jgi:hypothetical protein